jgi:hypothetical protein
MFFKKLRLHSSSESSKRRSTASEPSHIQSETTQSKATPQSVTSTELTPTLSSDYALFLEKSRRDDEKRERERLRIVEAQKRRREVDLSPWGRRM